MRNLCDLNHFQMIPSDSLVNHRTAVRAIIQHNGLLLLIHSTVNGDYKFPGGGVEPEETQPEALIREVLEETGFVTRQVGELFGYAHEIRPSNLPGVQVLVMDSFYYFLEIACPTENQSLNLDDYEADLGFHPVWISAEDAVSANRRVLAGQAVPLWTERDTIVLSTLLDEFPVFRTAPSLKP